MISKRREIREKMMKYKEEEKIKRKKKKRFYEAIFIISIESYYML